MKRLALFLGIVLLTGFISSCAKEGTTKTSQVYFNELVTNGKFQITLPDTTYKVAVIKAQFDKLIKDSITVSCSSVIEDVDTITQTIYMGRHTKVWDAIVSVRNVGYTLTFQIDSKNSVNSVYGYLSFVTPDED